MAAQMDSDGGDHQITNPDTDELLSDPSLGVCRTIMYRQIPITWTIVLGQFLIIGVEISAFLLPFFCYQGNANTCSFSPLSVTCYMECCLWAVFLLLDQYWRRQHNISRAMGYLDFYRWTRHIRRIPQMIVTGGSIVLLLLLTVIREYCDGNGSETHPCPSDTHLKPIHYLQMAISLQTVCCLVSLIVYMVRTVRFNIRRDSPDIQHEERALPSTSDAVDIGFRDETFVDNVLEKQADMIRYLKQHNEKLGRKILELTAQVDGSPRV